VYHRALSGLAECGVATVSSEGLALAAGVNPAMLRKDLSHLGSYGTRGVGYEVSDLLRYIGAALGVGSDCCVVIVGVGNLGHALANYGGFPGRGFRVAALVDADPLRTGEEVAGLQVRPLTELEAVVEAHAVRIGVIATPAGVAQDVCDRLVAAGVTGVLNFAPVVLTVPSGVGVRQVDLGTELQILAFHSQQQQRLDVVGVAR
jgi:redox-sensing transcriptional repressor